MTAAAAVHPLLTRILSSVMNSDDLEAYASAAPFEMSRMPYGSRSTSSIAADIHGTVARYVVIRRSGENDVVADDLLVIHQEVAARWRYVRLRQAGAHASIAEGWRTCNVVS